MEGINDRVILGIDPGTRIMGYGIIAIQSRKISVLKMGVIQLDPNDDHTLRLKQIFEQTIQLIEDFKPDELAIEAPFFGKNVQSMLKLGRAQGVAMAAGLTREVPIFEYSPRRIKQSITGKGSASKEQVAAMLQSMFNIKSTTKFLDATDGLAVAICHYYQTKHEISETGNLKPVSSDARKKGKSLISKTAGKSSNKSSWNKFVSDHPDRVQ